MNDAEPLWIAKSRGYAAPAVYRATEQTPEQIAERFALPIAWARQHIGQHRCLDGRTYIASCLVSDPTCDKIARNLIAR